MILLALFVLLFLVGVGGFFVVSAKRRTEPNPFAQSSAKPKQPFESDRVKRDVRLKQGFAGFKEKLATKNVDAIIVGSGIGGLTAGVLLAKAGKKVCILEQHDQIGGCCHTFSEKGFDFDTGVHYIGEMRNNTFFRFFFEQLTDGQLEWADCDEIFDIVTFVDDQNDLVKAKATVERHYKSGTQLPSNQIPVHSHPDRSIAALIKHFPKEEEGIRKFYNLMGDARAAMGGFIMLKLLPKVIAKFIVSTGLAQCFFTFFKLSAKSLSEVLNEVTMDPQLKAVLGYNFGDYGTVPDKTSFMMHAILCNHYMKGASYPAGGSSEFAYHMIPAIEKSGGHCLVRAPVEAIICNEKGEATGVSVKGVTLRAPKIISDVGIMNTANLLPTAVKETFTAPIIKYVKNGRAGISIFVGLNKSNEELKLPARHYWAFWTTKGDEDLSKVTERYYAMKSSEVADSPVPLLFISFPSAKDPKWSENHPGKATVTIVTVGSWEWFAEWESKRVKHRGDDYEQLKKKLGDLVWKQTVGLFPQLKDCVEYFEVGSPLSNKYYLGAHEGVMYGLDHDLKRFSPGGCVALRPETDVKNLFLTGQDVLSCGIGGAAMGGLLCSSAVLNRNLYSDLMTLRSSCSSTSN
eukprot:GHVN01084969.1.p1 GENE.GHVN01084969.1~~GHVN01084969.1.p1  ORF type:complete len:630 (+),score=71.82 GHVN01084969.1:182-2071(+)